MTVEIIGRAVRAPSASNVDELFDLLKNGCCVVSTIPDDRWGKARFWHPVTGTPGKAYTFRAGILDRIFDFDPAAFGLTAREAMYIDPQQRILLELVLRALEDASLPVSALQKERVGVYIGASSLDNGNMYVEDPAAGGPYFMTGNTLSIIANRISHVFGFSGPSLTIDTACSSSLVALDQAVRALERGDVDTAIVGGISILAHPFPFVGFSQARMLSPEGLCRAYGRDGQGYVRAEGGGAIVLRSTSSSTANFDRSYARIVATGLNSAGRTNGISLPSRESQAALLRSIYNGREIDPAELAFIEGHGTGTRVGDPAELWAIGSELAQKRQDPLPIGSIKTNLGHAEPASGMFGLIKATLALQHDFLPASLHAEELNDEVDFGELNVRVNTIGRQLIRGEMRRLAGINSFGFGGTNAHVVIADPDPVETTVAASPGIFMVSAHTEEALSRLLQSYQTLIRGSETNAADIIAASAGNRSIYKHRFAIGSNDPADVLEGIRTHLASEASSSVHRGEASPLNTKIAFAFSGNGCQWAGMALDAYQYDMAFRSRFQEISTSFRAWLDADLDALLQSDELAEHLVDTRIGQALLFAIQAALSDTLIARDVKPDVVFGHSVGEVAAAYCAGCLSLEDAVAVVAVRSRHQHALAGEGTMAAVSLAPESAIQFSRDNGLTGIELGAVNTSTSVTISGPTDEIREYRSAARKAHIPVHVLDIPYPFHHPVIDRERDAFLREVPSYEPLRAKITFVSSVTGSVVEGEDLNAAYWWKNVRDVVRFADATNVAVELGCNLFIEISPRPILSSYLAESARNSNAMVAVVPTLNRPARSANPLPHIVASAVANGALPWAGNEVRFRRSWVQLPTLPFVRQELRPARTSDSINLFDRDERKPYTLLGWRTDPKGTSWKNHIDAHLFPDLAEHVVDGKAILPGSAFIEIAIEAASHFHETSDVEIRNLEIVRPLELLTDRLSELSTVLSPETGQVEIRSREYLSDDDWVVHAVARVRTPVAALSANVDSRLVNNGSTHRTTASQAYATAKLFGLDYGNSFQLLEAATLADNRVVEVDLRQPEAAAHPYVSYFLNPASVDAAFHGLVAFFSQFTGDRGGAPYIPVRFGSIRARSTGNDIRRARIEIERMSAHTLKARFDLIDENGLVVAALDDCRFRRTFLKRHHNLASISYHYEAISQVRDTRRDLPVSPVAPNLEDEPISPASLLLDAAIYRACLDIARRVVVEARDHELDAFKDVPNLRSYIANCLLILEDSGLAKMVDSKWSLSDGSELPKVDEIVRELSTKFPERAAATTLVNDAYRSVMTQIEVIYSTGGLPGGSNFRPAEATLDHARNHSALSRRRSNEVCRLVESYLCTAPSPSTLTIAEFSATSVAVSARLAAITDRYGSNLVILEEDEIVRRSLEVALAGNPRVSVIDGGLESFSRPVDLVVSADGFLCSRLARDGEMKSAMRKIADGGASIVLIEHPSTVLADFILGLGDDWFAQSAVADLPISRMLTPIQMCDLIKDLGFKEVSARRSELADGPLVVVTGRGEAAAFDRAQPPLRSGLLVIKSPECEPLRVETSHIAQLPWTSNLSANVVAGAIAAMPRGDFDIAYVLPREYGPNPSLEIQDHLAVLSALAEALQSILGAAGSKPRLVIVAPGAAPVHVTQPNPINQAVWSFARVLQNEYDEFDLVLADIAPNCLSTEAWSDVIALHEAGESELVFDGGSTVFKSLRIVRGPFAQAGRLTSSFEAATIDQKVPGRIETIGWQACRRPEPGSDEVLVEVLAAGLNFRDVMWAMGLLPEEALEDGFAGATIGMEFSGTVIAVGAGVGDIAVGDAVMGIGSNAFSTHVVVPRIGVTRVPDEIDLVQAATLPVTFLTAYYALVELARIRSGDTILIHGAAGGVGLAALQIAKLKGATVIATAGTNEKRHLISALGADQVYDSRSLQFVNDVLDGTGGAGVDIVVNSLFSEAMERSLELLKPFGRFLELGKRDYYADRKISLRPFRKNISYFGIDADQLLIDVPHVTAKIFSEISDLFGEGKLRPLPYRAFPYDEITSAFRLMQGSGHIGKIVVTPPTSGRDGVMPECPEQLDLSPGVYLVVGGIGGFGLETANWLAEKGATHIALATRRGQVDAGTKTAIDRWANAGIASSVHSCDVTDEAQVDALLAELRLRGPLKGIVHAAMVLDDALIANLNRQRNQPVIDAKVAGAINLDRLTKSDELELFLLFSSATTMVGNPGQANYVAANGFLEGLARDRRLRGMAALAVGFGAIADTGFLARNGAVTDLLSKRIGKAALRARDALRYVEDYLRADPGTSESAVVMVAEIDWRAASVLPIAKRSMLSAVVLAEGSQHSEADQVDLRSALAGKSAVEVDRILHRLVASELASILKLAEQNITPDRVLRDIGLDSLMAMELGTSFHQKTGIDLPLSGVSDTTTVGHIVTKLREKLLSRTAGADTSDDDEILTGLTSRHAEEPVAAVA